MRDLDRQQELAWLAKVIAEAHRQFEENCAGSAKVEAEALDTQKELWEDVGSISISNGLHQLVDFLEYINTMKRQKRSHGFMQKQKQKYEKIMLSPYFGRIDFQEKGEEAAMAYYIGAFSLLDARHEILVCDWRAPISSLFYDFEIGEAAYLCPQGKAEGSLSLKRQYKIQGGEMLYMFDSELKIDDEMLQQMLTQNTGDKMKAIVTSIQREQNRAIRNEQYKNLIVQGPAGSGKTSIALHRAAYLLYKHRDTITSRNILIFSPNGIFGDYIANVLPELGEDAILQTTFADYMQNTLDTHLKLENYYDMMEYLLSGRERPTYPQRINAIKCKASVAFLEALRQYAAGVERECRDFKDLSYGGKAVVTAAELQKLFAEEYAYLPLRKRLEKMRARVLYLLQNQEEGRAKEIMAALSGAAGLESKGALAKQTRRQAREETEAVREAADHMLQFDLLAIYRGLFSRADLFAGTKLEGELPAIRAYTLENMAAGQLYYEDQIPLLYLQGALGGAPKTSDIKFVLIDEAQDYTPLQYEILRRLFCHADMTLLGDLDQAILPFMSLGSYENLARIFPQADTMLLRLAKSYRSTLEISRFAAKLLKRDIGAGAIERHGAEPVLRQFKGEEALLAQIAADIKAYTEAGFPSIAIITRTRAEAEAVYRHIGKGASLAAILTGEEEYARGPVVLPAYLAKGLEFDVAILYNANADAYRDEAELPLLYTACTRALHVLCVYYCGERSPFLP